MNVSAITAPACQRQLGAAPCHFNTKRQPGAKSKPGGLESGERGKCTSGRQTVETHRDAVGTGARPSGIPKPEQSLLPLTHTHVCPSFHLPTTHPHV